MAVIALVSARYSPGVSTAALAFTLAWRRRVLLAECDPAGGDILAGYLSGSDIPGNRGLVQLAMADLRDETDAEFTSRFWDQLIDLEPPKRQRLVLPGISDPSQAGTLRPGWRRLADFFGGLAYRDPGYDVIADCGRLATPNPPVELLARVDLILLAVRPTSLRSIAPAAPALAQLHREMPDGPEVGLLLIGDEDYPRRAVERQLRTRMVASLPDDPRAASALDRGRAWLHRPLLRAAATAEHHVLAALTERRHGDADGLRQLKHRAEAAHG